MAAIATFAAALKSIWTRFVERDATAAAMAGLGPNLRKEAGLPPETGAWSR
jgi:hypothetical protein